MRVTKLLAFVTVLMIIATVAMPASAKTLTVSSTLQPFFSVCTEVPGAGCVAQLPVGGTTMFVASDSEAAFDPWGFGADTSDQVALDSLWVGGASWTPCPGCTNPPFAGANIWIQNACDVNGVCENGNVLEPFGFWNAPGAFWNFNGVITWQVTDENGGVSDLILIGNFGPGGDAGFKFASVPEPSSLLLLGSGLIGAVGIARRRFLK